MAFAAVRSIDKEFRRGTYRRGYCGTFFLIGVGNMIVTKAMLGVLTEKAKVSHGLRQSMDIIDSEEDGRYEK